MSENAVATELASSSHLSASTTTAGMTARVLRGTLWTLGGQAIMLLGSFIATPFIVRLLGTENYGVLALINILIGYLAFADMGMGLAATRFGANAHSKFDDKNEATIVWTSIVIAAIPAASFAALLVSLAVPVVQHALHVPPAIQEVAVTALRLGALGFFVSSISGVLASPQLARLRMDLTTLVSIGAAILQNCIIPILLLLGFGLISVVGAMTGVRIASLIANAIISQRLLPKLLRPRIDNALIKPLLSFGGGLVLSTLAGMILMSAEKLLLARYASVTALAHYSIAFTVASLLGVVPAAMRQSLLPAFSQLQSVPERESLKQLYSRVLRGTLLWIGPAALLLCVGAKPFFTVWAGSEFGRESTFPFYLLVGGLIFNVMAYIPHSLLMALRRSDLIAWFHWAELLPYILCAAVLTYYCGAVGAALAWSLRVVVDAALFFLAAHRIAAFSPSPFPIRQGTYVIALVILVVPALLIFYAPSSALLASTTLLSLLSYGVLVWVRLLTKTERAWVSKIPILFRRDLVGTI